MSVYPPDALKTIAKGLAARPEPGDPPMPLADLEALKALMLETGDTAQAIEKWQAMKSAKSAEEKR